jgi:hypothetical protein
MIERKEESNQIKINIKKDPGLVNWPTVDLISVI